MRLAFVVLLAAACGSTAKPPQPLPRSAFAEGRDCNFELGEMPGYPEGYQPPRIQIIDAGRAPRQPIRRGRILAAPQTWIYRNDVGVMAKLLDYDSGDWLMHTAVYELSVVPQQVTTEFKVERAEVTRLEAGPGFRKDERPTPYTPNIEMLPAAIMNRPRVDIGSSFWVRFDGAGRLVTSPPGDDEPPFTDDNLEPERTELPADALGIGARWVVTERNEPRSTRQTFELVDRQGDVATLRVVTIESIRPLAHLNGYERKYTFRDRKTTETWTVDARTPVIAYQGKRLTEWVKVHCQSGRMRFEREQERVDATFAPAP